MRFRPLCLFVLSVLQISVLATLAPQCLAAGTPVGTAGYDGFDSAVFERLEWRSIGPCNMGGRVADVEGVPGNPNIVYVGSASGGVWKTTNAGTTWTPIFERQGTLSVGDLAIQPENPDVIWVGTGESQTRNSVSFGDGVYKSNDGGKTWSHMGSKKPSECPGSPFIRQTPTSSMLRQSATRLAAMKNAASS
jgi:photosystem II stability/assembly factor-like uncharacterized protein